jgi:hypothetical protein
MKYLLVVLLACGMAHAENLAVSTPAAASVPDAPSHRPFWTLETKIDFGVLGALVAVDGITTQRGLNQGYREANPLMRPFVTRGAGGEAVGSALGFGAGLGTVYVLHRTRHYKAERIVMRMFVAGEGAVVGHNLAVLH